ncbi:MAG: ABC transporter ATP-binding protein [Gammaproteobacteria bacterium]|nr:ABC transporter ATP-binding protein [Gammaproteobacteria bacterium]
MSELIRCTNVCKDYVRGAESIRVLRNVDLSVAVGTIVALMGPSGSGKTTLLNLIGGLDAPTSGEIEVDGLRLDSVSARHLARWRVRSVGFVFQFYNLLPVLTAQGNVELPLLLTDLSRSERKRNAALALDIVGLGDRGRHKPGELSGGQQQRVAIARALVSDPRLLVCDEPTGDLDRQTADEILELLQTLHRDLGKTIVMVTHDPKAADHAMVTLHMDKGKLASQDDQAASALPSARTVA